MIDIDNLDKTTPFDQYSRQFRAATIIDSLRKPGHRLTILDVGGYKGKTAEFLPQDTVTVLDVFDVREANYVKGDGTQLPFDDNSFDITCSFDVFEHIPREVRSKFVDESLRVSRLGVLIAMPVDPGDGTVVLAEKAMNNMFRQLYGEDHRWLKEHIDYRIPTEQELVMALSGTGASFVSLASNQVTDWQLLQTIIFIAAKNSRATHISATLNQWYNQTIERLERGVGPGYRRIYFVSHDSSAVKTVSKIIDELSTFDNNSDPLLPVHSTTLDKTLEAFALICKESNDAYEDLSARHQALVKKYELLQKETLKAEQDIEILARQVRALQSSLSWRLMRPFRQVIQYVKRK